MTRLLSVRPRALSLAAALCALSTFAAGCSSTGDDNSSADQGLNGAGGEASDLNYCVTTDDAPEFTQGLTITSLNSTFDVAIADATPPSPTMGTNTWTFAVTNKADGTPVTDAVLDITCSMVGHSHGCAVTPKVTSNGDGTYTLAPLIFNMTKHWDIRVKVAAGGVTDYSIFPVCIP